MCPHLDRAEQAGEQSRFYHPGGHDFGNVIPAFIKYTLQVYFRAGIVRQDLTT
jgi:hypothetical protein